MPAVEHSATTSTPLAPWRLRWLGFRNRLLSSPGFQRWAAAFPFTRFVARRRARALFDLSAGFVYSQVLAAGIELGLYQKLESGPLSLAALAEALGLPLAGARRLAEASAALQLLERIGVDHYALGIHGAALLGNPAVAQMVAHHRLFYRDLADPVALLGGTHGPTALAQFWSYATRDRAAPPNGVEVGPYSALMAGSQALIAEDILEAYPFGQHQCLLDVGGGEGAFLSSVAAAHPSLRLMLFDLPAVAARAEAALAARALLGRARAVGGDVFRDPLPAGADVISLVRVLHDHDDPQALAILRAARAALPPGGVVVIAEPLAQTRGAEAIGAYFELYLLAMGQGRPRTAAELSVLLRQAGFVAPKVLPTRRPMLTGLLIARVE